MKLNTKKNILKTLAIISVFRIQIISELIRYLDQDQGSELTKLKPLTVKMKTYGEQTIHKLARLTIMILR
jgi:hypothetical protein